MTGACAPAEPGGNEALAPDEGGDREEVADTDQGGDDGYTGQPCTLRVEGATFDGVCITRSSSTQGPQVYYSTVTLAGTSPEWQFHLEKHQTARGDGVTSWTIEAVLTRVVDGARWNGNSRHDGFGTLDAGTGLIDLTITHFGELFTETIHRSWLAKLHGSVTSTLVADPAWAPPVPSLPEVHMSLAF